jgi:hypothetical protein
VWYYREQVNSMLGLCIFIFIIIALSFTVRISQHHLNSVYKSENSVQAYVSITLSVKVVSVLN